MGADDSLLGAFAVAITEGAASFIAVLSLALLKVGHTENVESVLYIVAFIGLLPLTVGSAWWRHRSLSARDLSTLGVLDTAALAVALAFCRAAGSGPKGLLVASVVILAGSVLLAGPWRSRLGRTAELGELPDWLAVPFLFVAALCFLPSWVYSSKGFIAAFPVSLLAAALPTTFRWLPRATMAVDAVAVLLIGATIFDVFFWGPDYLLYTHDWYLGPVNEILHGRTMLVDVFAQYGVGVMYFLSGLFVPIPIGYGTFALTLSGLTILEFVGLYTIVRIAGRSQPIAVLTSAVAIVFVIYGQIQSFDVYPSTGVLRFGLPFVVILLETLAARASDGGRWLRLASAAATALASLWSFETFAYTLTTYLAVAATEAVAERTAWRSAVRGRVLPLFSFIVAAQYLFAVGTRVASGHWPSWGTYLAFVRLYSVQSFGTLPVAPWSPGLLLGGVLFASAVLLALITIRKPMLVGERPELFAALAGSTGFGILGFTYFLGRSHPNNLHHIAPPAIMACALWLCVVMERTDLRPVLRFSLLAVSAWAAFMLVAGTRSELDAKWTHSALGTLLADGPSALARRVDFLASRPAVDPRAAEAAALLVRFDPGKSRSLVLLSPQLTPEVLLLAQRANAIPIATPLQDAMLRETTRLALGAVPTLPEGTIMIADSGYLTEQPYSNPGPTLTELAVWRVRSLFTLRTLIETADGTTVARLSVRLATGPG